MDTTEFTNQLLEYLLRIFPERAIKKEWDVGTRSQDDFSRLDMYSPKTDIAIGPLNIDRQIKRNNREFNRLIKKHQLLIKTLYKISHLGQNRENISFSDFIESLNRNPRCFIAIEIENTLDRKRAIGDILNASAMGKIGLAVPIGLNKYEMFIKIKEYFKFLEKVKKLRGNFKNVLIVEGANLLSTLSEF